MRRCYLASSVLPAAETGSSRRPLASLSVIAFRYPSIPSVSRPKGIAHAWRRHILRPMLWTPGDKRGRLGTRCTSNPGLRCDGVLHMSLVQIGIGSTWRQLLTHAPLSKVDEYVASSVWG